MAQDADSYTVLQHPFRPGEIIRAKVLKSRTIKEDWNEYELEDGTRVRIKMEVNLFAAPIDPTTGAPLVNPQSGEPVIHANWTVRMVTQFSGETIKKYTGGKP